MHMRRRGIASDVPVRGGRNTFFGKKELAAEDSNLEGHRCLSFVIADG